MKWSEKGCRGNLGYNSGGWHWNKAQHSLVHGVDEGCSYSKLKTNNLRKWLRTKLSETRLEYNMERRKVERLEMKLKKVSWEDL